MYAFVDAMSAATAWQSSVVDALARRAPAILFNPSWALCRQDSAEPQEDSTVAEKLHCAAGAIWLSSSSEMVWKSCSAVE